MGQEIQKKHQNRNKQFPKQFRTRSKGLEKSLYTTGSVWHNGINTSNLAAKNEGVKITVHSLISQRFSLKNMVTHFWRVR